MTTVGTLELIFGLGVLIAVSGLLVWVTRRHNRMYPKGRDRINRDPEAAQATRRFETMWAFFSGRGGGGL